MSNVASYPKLYLLFVDMNKAVGKIQIEELTITSATEKRYNFKPTNILRRRYINVTNLGIVYTNMTGRIIHLITKNPQGGIEVMKKEVLKVYKRYLESVDRFRQFVTDIENQVIEL